MELKETEKPHDKRLVTIKLNRCHIRREFNFYSVIWTAKNNVAPTDGVEKVVKDTQPKAGKVDPRFDRADNEARDAFIDRVKKEIKGAEIKDITTPAKVNPIEKLVRLNNRDVAHVTNRAQMFFGIGLKTSNGNEILKLHDQKEVDSAFEKLVKLCDEVSHQAPRIAKKFSKKSKNSKPEDSKLSDEEIIEGAKERIANLDNGSKGIGMGKGDLTKGVVKWAKEQGYSVSGDQILLNKP